MFLVQEIMLNIFIIIWLVEGWNKKVEQNLMYFISCEM